MTLKARITEDMKSAMRAKEAAKLGTIRLITAAMKQKEVDERVVLATNVAETSLTIPGITIVIDSGMARIARFDPKRGINTLFAEPISVSSADQRAGRAGRTAPGTCIRLWSEFEHNTRFLPARAQPSRE